MDPHSEALRIGADAAMYVLQNTQFPFSTLKPVRGAYITAADVYVQHLVATNSADLLYGPDLSSEILVRVMQESLTGVLSPLQSNMMSALLHVDAAFYRDCWRDVRHRAGLMHQDELNAPLVAREVYYRETSIHQTREVLRAWRRYLDAVQAHRAMIAPEIYDGHRIANFVSQATVGFNRWADLVFAQGGYPFEEDPAEPAGPLRVYPPSRLEAASCLVDLATSRPRIPAIAPPEEGGNSSDSEVTIADHELPRYLAEAQARAAMRAANQTRPQQEPALPNTQEDVEMAESNAASEQAPAVPANPASIIAMTQATQAPGPTQAPAPASAAPAPAPAQAPPVRRFVCDLCPRHRGVTSIAILRRHWRLVHDMPVRDTQAKAKQMYPGERG
ncbi:hypothetical protein B0A52_06972 [Exophiala mesophila]|uniref:Uncharacterized protein n=1 Tax=Exophiala mesophila TaxID=212818 RepID=A0A438N109_EXOME|nr:hypothetical protein B0A52_06972 [Exophiala mesophila]